MSKSLRYLGYLLTLGFVLSVNIWAESLSDLEKRVTLRFQTVSMVGFADFVSDRFLLGTMVVYFIITYNLESYRPRFYYEALVAMAGVALVSLLKLIFAQGRPYQRFNEVEALACECDYGMPSGHSFTSSMMVYLAVMRCSEWLWSTR